MGLAADLVQKLSPLVTALAVRPPAQRAIAQRFLAPLGPPRRSALPPLLGAKRTSVSDC
jgi:hypothetical protein